MEDLGYFRQYETINGKFNKRERERETSYRYKQRNVGRLTRIYYSHCVVHPRSKRCSERTKRGRYAWNEKRLIFAFQGQR